MNITRQGGHYLLFGMLQYVVDWGITVGLSHKGLGFELANVAGHDLTLGNYHALGGLAGSHYTGLQFRGARDLLDEHGDAKIGITADGGLAGETAVHGTAARWMEWACQHDGSLRRNRLLFENTGAPLQSFARARTPLAAFAFHREGTQSLPAGATLRLEHTLTFTCA